MDNNLSPATEYVEYIGKLPGVLNSKLIFDGEDITEVHILSDFSRTPKQLVRDIQSLFMARFNRELDHRIISIAQIDLNCPERSSSRLTIDEINCIKRRDNVEYRVSLFYKGELFTGVRKCTIDGLDSSRALAQATLDAAAAANGSGEALLSLSDLRFCDLGGESVVVVCVSIKPTGGSTGRFCGSAFVAGDGDLGIVRATLSAINRKIFNS